jgi:hypothetical protein
MKTMPNVSKSIQSKGTNAPAKDPKTVIKPAKTVVGNVKKDSVAASKMIKTVKKDSVATKTTTKPFNKTVKSTPVRKP